MPTPHNEIGTKGGGLISEELKKMLVPIVITLVISFGGSWYANQQSQAELRYQTQANKEAIAVNLAAIKANSEAINQVVISMARFSEAQSRIAEDLKRLQDDQRMNNAQMNRQR